MKFYGTESGFTLLELLIVVIIVGILAGVALPQFSNMTRRARQSEAQNMLGSILTAEALYYNENGVFTNTMARLLVDLPAESANEHWNYAVTAGDNTVGPVGVTATGDAGSPAAGMTVIGTLINDGTRTIQ